MKRSSILWGVLIICLCLIWPQVGQAAPRLEIAEGMAYDFGDVKANTTLSHTFILKNVGDSVLKIERVKGG
jgi:hypothetical protein